MCESSGIRQAIYTYLRGAELQSEPYTIRLPMGMCYFAAEIDRCCTLHGRLVGSADKDVLDRHSRTGSSHADCMLCEFLVGDRFLCGVTE